MKYKIKSTPALDYISQDDFSDCQDIILQTPMYNDKAKLVYASKATSHKIHSKQDLKSLAFLHDNSPGMMLIKIGGGAFHYFIIQKENIDNQSFFRIFQAYDQGYTLQDWFNNDREWHTPAKKQFGNGQWLDSEQINDFIQNMERIISDKDSEAYFQNFGVREEIKDDVFIVANIFAKDVDSKESISIEVIQEQNQSIATVTPLGMNTSIDDESDHLTQDELSSINTYIHISNKIDTHIEALKNSKNPFLSSPDAKVAALYILKDMLTDKTHQNKSVSDIIEEWSKSNHFKNTKTQEIASVCKTIHQHSNIFRSATQDKETSTQHFINDLKKDFGDVIFGGKCQGVVPSNY